jgi:hypothetical protein
MRQRGLNEDSEVVTIPLPVRAGVAVCGFVAFLVVKRSVFAGVIVGEAALLLGGYLFSH